LHKHGGLVFLTKCNFPASIFDLDDALLTFYKKMLDYWCEFKILTGKTNPKNEILWNSTGKFLWEKKKLFFIKIGMTPALPR